MIDIEEILAGDTHRVAEAMLVLRPRWKSAADLVELIDEKLRPVGYRLVAAFREDNRSAVSVAGFREMISLAWGRYLYVDDVSTLPSERGSGYADALMTWLEQEAGRLDCGGLHLDSGVNADRAPAHRLYMRHKLWISAHHFERSL